MNTIGKIPATKQDVETAVENAIDKLALMINEGFQTTASKEDIKELRTEMQAGFDRIEHLLLAEQKREIEDFKQRMKRLEDALAVYSPTKKAASEWQLFVAVGVLPRPCEPLALLDVRVHAASRQAATVLPWGIRAPCGSPPRALP